MLDAPSSFHKLSGQPVQQFRMRGLFTLCAKVFAGPNQTAPEQFLPQAVHSNTSRERVFSSDEPFGERQTIRALFQRR